MGTMVVIVLAVLSALWFSTIDRGAIATIGAQPFVDELMADSNVLPIWYVATLLSILVAGGGKRLHLPPWAGTAALAFLSYMPPLAVFLYVTNRVYGAIMFAPAANLPLVFLSLGTVVVSWANASVLAEAISQWVSRHLFDSRGSSRNGAV